MQDQELERNSSNQKNNSMQQDNFEQQLLLIGHLQSLNLSSFQYSLTLKEKILKIGCGKNHITVLSEFGSVYSNIEELLGNQVVPQRQQIRLSKVIEEGMKGISCGWYHSVAWNQTSVYSWGEQKFGALGYEKSSGKKKIAKKIPLLLEKTQKVEFVACGAKNTLIKLNKMIVGFGDNTYGQLGLFIKKTYILPEIIRIYDQFGHSLKANIIQISICEKFIIMLDDNNQIYGAGNLNHFIRDSYLGQLNGFNSIQLDKIGPITQICCQSSKIGILTKESLFFFQNGIKKTEQLKNIEIDEIYLGRQFGICRKTNSEIYYWGKLPKLEYQKVKLTNNNFFKKIPLEIIQKNSLINCCEDYICIVGLKKKEKVIVNSQFCLSKEISPQNRMAQLQEQVNHYRIKIEQYEKKCKIYEEIISRNNFKEQKYKQLGQNNQYLEIINLQEKIIQKLGAQNQKRKETKAVFDNTMQITSEIDEQIETIGKYLMELNIILDNQC